MEVDLVLDPSFNLLFCLQIETGGIDTVAFAVGSGAVVEDVAEVGVAALATDFDAGHAMTHVFLECNMLAIDRIGETWPTAA